ncbi:MAG: hypothetical protein J6O55_09145, partial [Lachnospiraceae bacterium]|nr:hypothetical protein [Lachnospiraceae bacterium]
DNIQDGISYCQVADGALEEVHDMFNRLTELSVKAANGTLSPEDRMDVDNEVQEIKNEMSRIFETTKFNERFIWDQAKVGEMEITGYTSQVATYAVGETNIHNLKNSNKAVWPVSGDGTGNYGYFNISASEADGFEISWTGLNGKEYTTGTVAWPEGEFYTTHEVDLQALLQSHYANDNEKLSEVEGIECKLYYTPNSYATLADLAQDMNGSSLRVYISTSNMGELYDSNGSKLSGANMSWSSGNSAEGTVNLTYAAIVKSERDLENSSDTSFAVPVDAAGNESKNNVISQPTMDGNGNYTGNWQMRFKFDGIGYVTATSSSSVNYYLNADRDDNGPDRDTKDSRRSGSNYQQSRGGDKWWGYTTYKYANGSSYTYASSSVRSTSGAGTAEAIKKALIKDNGTTHGGLFRDLDGKRDDSGYIYFNFTLTAEEAFKIEDSNKEYTNVGSYTLYIPFIKESDFDPGLTEQENVNKIIERALTMKGMDIFSSNNSRNNSDEGGVGYKSIGMSFYPGTHSVSIPVYGFKKDEKGNDIYHYDKQYLDIQTAAHNSEDYIIGLEYDCLNLDVLGIKNLNTETVEDAREAIDLIREASAKVSFQRSMFGAYQNRLEAAKKVNMNTSENTQAGESRIRDTDMPKEMVKFSKENILQQAGQSMLAQANQSNQGILSLLQ